MRRRHKRASQGTHPWLLEDRLRISGARYIAKAAWTPHAVVDGNLVTCGWRIVVFPRIRRNFRILLRFCDARSGRPFDPFHRYPGSSARTRRWPFPRCRVASAQASTPGPESLPATSAESVRDGPDLCWLAAALAASHSRAPLCHCAEALDPDRPSPSHVQEKVPHAVLPQSPSQARPEGTECRTHPCGCGNEATEPPLGLSANCRTDRLGLQPSD